MWARSTGEQGPDLASTCPGGVYSCSGSFSDALNIRCTCRDGEASRVHLIEAAEAFLSKHPQEGYCGQQRGSEAGTAGDEVRAQETGARRAACGRLLGPPATCLLPLMSRHMHCSHLLPLPDLPCPPNRLSSQCS